MEITSAYSAFANRGVWVQPLAISRVIDRRGATLQEFVAERREIISEAKAYLLLDLMKGVVNAGTGGSLRWKYDFYRPAAGKTGTTDNWTDAWFVGFTPQLTAGVWVGVDDPQVSLGYKRYGDAAALPIWARIMREIYQQFDYPTVDWEMSDGVVRMKVCDLTKDRPTKFCPTIWELFLEGTGPPDECQVHLGLEPGRFDPDDAIFMN